MSIKRQQGSVLLWSMVLLVTISTMTVVASQMATTDVHLASNQIQKMVVVQAAETTLARAVKDYRASAAQGLIQPIVQRGPFSDEIAGASVNSQATVRDGGVITCEDGSAGCRVYTVEVRAWLNGTGARHNLNSGILRYKPVLSTVP